MKENELADDRSALARLRVGAETFVKDVVPLLAKAFTPLLREGERLPDLAQLALLVLRLVEVRFDEVRSAAQVRRRASYALVPLERRRDATCARLTALLTELRDLSRCICRHRPGVHLPYETLDIPEDPHALARTADLALDWLREKPVPESAVLSLEPAQLVAEIEPLFTALRAALVGIEDEAPKVSSGEEMQARAHAAFEPVWNAAAQALAHLGLLAGEGAPARILRLER